MGRKIPLAEAIRSRAYGSRSTLDRRIAEGKLTKYRIGGVGRVYLDEDELDALFIPDAPLVAAKGARPTRAVPEQPRGSAA
ncbi:hypothetical protein [Tsukamurella spumae]|uniref:Uncharacterized protein n=1 Tax=Tsukamurella spumae TaxID=44753 RepID=A0A846X0E1_9ACTN|nr:hypothetical protein [Tsukamurella spumae]NKY17799.1 hypothetical protein [Tsukamurella spumae]